MSTSTYDPTRDHRRSIRLKDYDYSWPGGYFVTICAHNRQCIFGDVVDGEMRMNAFGRVVVGCWHDLVNHYPHVELDEFVIMPNHVHGIVILRHQTDVGAGFKPAPTHAAKTRQPLSEIVRALKTFSARRINRWRNTTGSPVWQRNYYEHVIRNEDDLHAIREYVINNPLKWDLDNYNPNLTNFNSNRRP